MVLGGAKGLQERFGAFANVGEGANAAGGVGEGVGKKRVVEDDGGAGGAQAFDGLHECFARFRTKVDLRRALQAGRRGGGSGGRDSLERDASAVQDEGRDAEAFALQRVLFQIRGV